MDNKKRIWIHWAFLGAIILYVCLFAIETGKFFVGPKANLSADLKEAAESNVKITDLGNGTFQTEIPATSPLIYDISFKQDGAKYVAGENIFKALINGTETRVEFLYDSSDGNKAGDWALWNPKIFLDDKEVLVKDKAPILTSIDSLNDTLEWDYGICKRKIQLKPNTFLEFYIFESDPKGDIKIQSNTQGNLKAQKYYAIDAEKKDIEGFIADKNQKFLPKESFVNISYPVIIDDTYSGVDMGQYHALERADSSYSGARTNSTATSRTLGGVFRVGQNRSGAIYEVYRGFLYFDTSSIPSNAIISSSTLRLYQDSTYNYKAFNLVNVKIKNVDHPATPLALADYLYTYYGASLSSEQGGSVAIPLGVSEGYKNIVFDADGISWITKGTGAVTRIVLRNSLDISGSVSPTQPEYVSLISSEGDINKAPTLLIEYTIPTPIISISPSTQDFGKVDTSSYKDLTFTVSNTGTAPLPGAATVTGAGFSCQGTCSYTIAPAGNQTITIRFTPTSTGSFSGTVNFSGGLGASATVTGSGFLRLFYETFPTADTAWNGSSDTPQNMPGWVTYQGTSDTNDVLISNSDSAGGTLPPSGGNHLTFNDADEGFQTPEAYDIAYVPVNLNGYENVDVSFYWQTDDVDTGEGLRVAYSNNSTNGKDGTWNLIGEYLNPTDDAWNLVTFSLPSQALNNNFKLRFSSKSNDASYENVFIDDVKITGLLAGQISLPQSFIQYSSVVKGSSSTLNLVIENIGTGTINGSVTDIAAPFSCGSSCSYIIPEGSSTTVPITFSPITGGEFTDTITLTGGGNTTAVLSGVALDAMPCQEGTRNVFGYAWSEGIGWVSFNCEGTDSTVDYGVNIDNSDLEAEKWYLEGYAWASNIGWIKFDGNTDCPEGEDCGSWVDTSSASLNGWARACSVFQTGCSGLLKDDLTLGGWDGWISFHDSSFINSNVSPAEFRGYLWGGSINVGWVSLNHENLEVDHIFDYNVYTTISLENAPTVLFGTEPVKTESCAPGGKEIITLEWQYYDEENMEDSFELKITDDPLGNNIIFHSTSTDATCVDDDPGTAVLCNNSQTITAGEDPLTSDLLFGQTYYWWVMVRSSVGGDSGWVQAPSPWDTFTTADGPAPSSDFLYPDSISLNEEVAFEAADLDGDTYSWSFGLNAVPATSDQPIATTTYSSGGEKTVSLTVSNVNGTCTTEKTINATLPLPDWTEIPPE